MNYADHANIGRGFLLETTWNFIPMMLLVYWRVQYAGYSLPCGSYEGKQPFSNKHVLVLGLGLEIILLDDTWVSIVIVMVLVKKN